MFDHRGFTAPTRPNLDFSDAGNGTFLRLMPVPEKKQERLPKDTRACAYLADTAASPDAAMCTCGERSTAGDKGKGRVVFGLPVTPLRVVPVERVGQGQLEAVHEKGERMDGYDGGRAVGTP